MSKLVSILLAAALLLVAPAAASAGGEIVRFKLLPSSEVVFGLPTEACPEGTKEVDMSTPGGRMIGRQHVCTQRSFPGDTHLVEVNRVTFDFGRGNTIVADATAVFGFSDDFSQATFRAAGVVTGGTGRYARARGWLAAHGLARFDETGAPRLDVDSIIVLR